MGRVFSGTVRALFCAAAAVTLALAGDVRAQEEASAPRVLVMKAAMTPVRASETFVGRGEAIDKVDVVARVSGYLEEALVKDGGPVAEGDLLFRIERSAYEAQLEAARAEQAKAEADLGLAGLELARAQELFSRGSVPEAERDRARATELVAEAQLRAAKAAVRQAELDLSYTEIRAPFSGRAGRIAVSTGDVVAPGGAPLVNIVRQAPVYVSFSVSERSFVEILQRIDEAAGEANRDEYLPEVFVILANGSELPERGSIAFSGNRIDPATGTVTVRAEFENEAGLILDGAFLTVGIQAQNPVDRIMISQAAIQRDQQGPFVLVVSEEGLAEQRYIVTGDVEGTGITVLDGLAAGEMVVTEGLQRIRPGVKIEPVLADQGGE